MIRRTSIFLLITIIVSGFGNLDNVKASEIQKNNTTNGAIVQNVTTSQYSENLELLKSQINSKVDATNEFETLLEDVTFKDNLVKYQFLTKLGEANFNTFQNNVEFKNFFSELLGNTYIMNGLLMGRTLNNSQMANAVKILKNIWENDTECHSGFYLKLAIATAIGHCEPIRTYDYKTEVIDPVIRYNHYKSLYNQGKLFENFDKYDIVHLSMIVNNPGSESDIDWMQEYIRTEHPSYVNQDEIKKAAFLVPYGPGKRGDGRKYHDTDWTLKDTILMAGVCGRLSHFGSIAVRTFGAPSTMIDQPGHRAFLHLQSENSWQIGNNIGGLVGTKFNGETVIPWGNHAAYLLLMEDASLDQGALEKSYHLYWLSNIVSSDLKADAIRDAAIKVQPLNYFPWKDKISKLLENENITKEQFEKLSFEIMNVFYNHPKVMEDLLKLFENRVVDTVNGDRKSLEEYIINYRNALNKCNVPIQKTVVNKLIQQLNQRDMYVVTFSFSGENAGKLMETNNSMEYTIDGGETWKSITGENMRLPKEDLDKIKSQYGIKVRVKGNTFINEIDINDKPEVPNVSANNNKNIIEGINSSMEYSTDGGVTWTNYSDSNPTEFISDVNVLVRVVGNGLTPPSESKELSFTSKITTVIYKEFDPMKYITVKDSDGNDITGNIEVIENTVDVNKKGIYSVTYKIIQGDKEKLITKEVDVVSDIEYLSDINYKSGKCGWRSIRKDTNVSGGQIVLHSMYGKDTFEKGITAHAPSEIVYDIENKGYTNFESYIGLDNTAYSSSSSVIFKVYVDGTLKYDSGVMTSKTPYKYVDVDIKDGKEIKIEVDSNGSNGVDHSVWADAKFVLKDSQPIIEATNVVYEKDDIIDFNELLKNVKVTDIEDGDLSSKVTYTTNYEKGSTGNFDIVYSVTDSEGYKAEKTVKLMVVNSSIYVSDTDWKSAKAGWSSTKKDLTINSNPLCLWDGEKEVIYEKGIGTHAYSETIYDLTDKNYGYFTSYVGAPKESNSATSIQFKVYVDGKLATETTVMGKDTPQEFIKVNIDGAKELKLIVTDGGNGKSNDGAIWGDAKFLIVDETAINIDTSNIDEVIKKAESLKEEEYEKDSWDALKEKLTAAKLLLSKGGAEQNQIDKLVEDINNAVASLKKFKGESPTINAENLLFYKGDKINFDDILSKVRATDKEDGDLSSKVTYTTNYVENEIGEFEIVYTVTDSEENNTTKNVKLDIQEKMVKEEVAQEEKSQEETVKEEVVQEEKSQEETVKEEKSQEETVKEEVAQEEKSQEETVKEEVAQEEVIERFIYATDIYWNSTMERWHESNKDVTITDKPLSLWDGEKEVTYKKGIGSSGYSSITYKVIDGIDKFFTGDYNLFTSYVGVPKECSANTSVVFKVYVDGNLVEETEPMTRDTTQKFIEVDIAGAKEIKLVVENNENGSEDDQAIWADAKFIK